MQRSHTGSERSKKRNHITAKINVKIIFHLVGLNLMKFIGTFLRFSKLQ